MVDSESFLMVIDTTKCAGGVGKLNGPIEGSVAIGRNAQAINGEICISNGEVSVVISKSGVFKNGVECPSDQVIGSFSQIFGTAVLGLLIKTPLVSFKIDHNGSVFVNGENVGEDPELLVRAIAFILGQFFQAFQR
jgi:hypothetical protein